MELAIIDIVFVILFSVVSFLASKNIILTACVGSVTLLYFTIIFNHRFTRYRLKISRYHECFNFINTFIISLSVTNSIMQAFERTTLNVSKKLNLELQGITNLEVVEKIKYLKKYFPFHVYSLFLNVLDLFIEQGGDILSMSSYLLKEARMIEEYIDACMTNALKKVVEVFLLWLLSLSLLVFIRFGLSQFFDKLSSQLFYPISIGVFFAFVLISVDISIRKLMDVEIQGFKYYEKVKKLHIKH